MSKIINIKKIEENNVVLFHRLVFSNTTAVAFDDEGVKLPEQLGFLDVSPTKWGHLVKGQQTPEQLEHRIHWFD